MGSCCKCFGVNTELETFNRSELRGGVSVLEERVTNSSQWSDCLNYLSRRVKEQSFKTWLRPTIGEPGANGDFRVAVPNQFVADWIRNHYQDMIEEALKEPPLDFSAEKE